MTASILKQTWTGTVVVVFSVGIYGLDLSLVELHTRIEMWDLTQVITVSERPSISEHALARRNTTGA